MTRDEIVAALTVAYGVAYVDGMTNDETEMLLREIKSFKFANDPAEVQDVIDRYKRMSIRQGINIIAAADEDASKEAHALILYTVAGDGELSDMAKGAFTLMKDICNLPEINSIEEAKAILCW